MPALDYANKTEEKVVDVSADVLTSTAAVNLGRGGLALGEGCTVTVIAASAADFTDTTLQFRFEVTYDNGTTWYIVGSRPAKIGAAGIPLQSVWIPVEFDNVPERFAAANIDWRVSAVLSATEASADDITFQGWLGNQNIGAEAVNKLVNA